jgi:hypothetical protein
LSLVRTVIKASILGVGEAEQKKEGRNSNTRQEKVQLAAGAL